MEETKRQKQMSSMISKEMSDIFQRMGYNIIGKGMVSISKVTITADLYEVRVFLSFFQIDNPEELLKEIKTRDWEIRKELALRIKNQVKKIPVLNYFMDDTLDYVFHMEEVFKKLKEEGE